jgi:hypothetical protein
MAAVARKLPHDCDKYRGKKNFQLRVANDRIACATQMQFQASLALFVLLLVNDSDDDDGAFEASLILTVMLISHISWSRSSLYGTDASGASAMLLLLLLLLVRVNCVPRVVVAFVASVQGGLYFVHVSPSLCIMPRFYMEPSASDDLSSSAGTTPVPKMPRGFPVVVTN